jgi:5-(carboxyamino)imidazole ribonucleotide mutase
MRGEDALWSIAQMPKGVPVATVAIGGAWNAGILAAQILGAGAAGRAANSANSANLESERLLDAVAAYKEGLRQQVLAKKLPTPHPSEPRSVGRRASRGGKRR